jgi:Icc-related predicted phosphoesterase
VVFGALGDIHGDFGAVRRIQRRHPLVPFWLCVGDVADDEGRYEPFDAPVHWIKGNNENFDAVTAGALPPNVLYLPNGERRQLGDIAVAGLGGTFAPTVHELAADALPHPVKTTAKATALADRRRHFVRAEVEACKALVGVDVFLSHEAPRPFVVRGNDAGKTPINEVLAALRPRLHLFGHHHQFSERNLKEVPSVGLDLASRSYLLIDSVTLAYERHDNDVS